MSLAKMTLLALFAIYALSDVLEIGKDRGVKTSGQGAADVLQLGILAWLVVIA